jgi:hypothetical protein
MQAGIPVVASNLPVHQRLLAQNRGLLFPVGDVDSCINCLDWAVHHPQELAAMAQTSQAYIQENYNWDNITTDMLNLYTKLSPYRNNPIHHSRFQNHPLRAILPCSRSPIPKSLVKLDIFAA